MGKVEISSKAFSLLKEASNRERKKRFSEAFNWAEKEQMRIGCIAEPINIKIDPDDMYKVENGCIMSIFLDEELRKVILRRDWLKTGEVKYNTLSYNNFQKISVAAPKSVNFMLENAVKLYYYFDGPDGGVTKFCPDNWDSWV